MPICPDCESYNSAGNAFCAHCGGGLLRPPKKSGASPDAQRSVASRLVPLFATVLVLGIVAVAVISLLPERSVEPEVNPIVSGATRVSELDVAGDPGAEEALSEPNRGADVERISLVEAVGEPRPARAFDRSELGRRVTPTVVVVELYGNDGEQRSVTRGVLVSKAGVVLCRWRVLLGATRGTCRLSSRRAEEVEVLGVSAYDEVADLALLRVRPNARTFAAVPLLEESPATALEVGASLFVFSDYKALPVELESLYHQSDDGISRLSLATPDVPPEVFLAVDRYGYVIGLCRPEVNGSVVDKPSARLPRSGHRIVIDSAFDLSSQVDRPVSLTLSGLTEVAYTGTFVAHVAEGDRHHAKKAWRNAIESFEKALERVPFDTPAASDVERVSRELEVAYEKLLHRLSREEKRFGEAVALGELAVERFPKNGRLFFLLGEAQAAGKQYAVAVQSLVAAKARGQSATTVAPLLEGAYLALAQAADANEDDRTLEARLLEGLVHVPDSGNLSFELAKLYFRLGDYDAALRLTQDAKRLDASLRPLADDLAQRIQDVFNQQDAVVIPISSDQRSYRTTALVDAAQDVTFIIDTGATYTTIPAGVAAQLGYDLSRASTINLRTASGTLAAPLIQLSSIDVQGYAVSNMKAVVLPDGVGPREGLLGLNYLRHFKYTVDASRNEFRLQRP